MTKTLSLAAQAVLCAYRDLSWTPDEEDNGKYLKFSHKAGMAAALRAAADQLAYEDAEGRKFIYVPELLAIAAELEGNA
jgi:hypothetical protein